MSWPPCSHGVSLTFNYPPLPHDITVVMMVQKVLDIVGISPESFSKAAQDAVMQCSRTVRGIRWARAKEFECKVEGDRIVEYRATMSIYFDVEGRE